MTDIPYKINKILELYKDVCVGKNHQPVKGRNIKKYCSEQGHVADTRLEAQKNQKKAA